jgi:tetratricopeptide (TPR) repeat protein
VLALREKSFGPENAAVAEVLNDLGLLSILKGDDAAARAALDRALAIERKTVGEAHLHTMQTYGHLGRLHLRRAEYDAAEAAYRKGLAAAEAVRGAEARENVPLLRGLADVALRRHRPLEAEPLLARALAIADKDEPGRAELGPALNGLGALRYAQRRLDEARAALERARGVPAPSPGLRVETLTLLAHVLMAQGQGEAAEPLYREAIDLAGKPQGSSQVEAAEPLAGLGAALARRGQRAEAIASLERALLLRRRVLGRTHPETLATARTLVALSTRS